MNTELFLQEEIRNDFFVDKKRKEIWAVELDLLSKFIEVCKKNNIKCFAFGGTLLGAVRHKGFIPWDDDVDMAMMREEYEKLCKIAKKEFEDPYFFQNATTDSNYFIGMSRLRRSDTTGIVKGFCNHKYNNGIALDIYVYDVIPNKKWKLKNQLLSLKLYETLLNNYYYFNSNTKKMRCFKPLFSLTKHCVSYRKLFDKYKNKCMMYNDSGFRRMAFLCNPTFLKYSIKKQEIDELIETQFEYMNIPIPKGYDAMLKRAYGNYMEFPPVSQRGEWHKGMVIFDVECSYVDYYKKHEQEYADVLKEYNY